MPLSMNIRIRNLLVFVLLAVLCSFAWIKFEYPRFTSIYLPVTKQKALFNAVEYLRSQGADPKAYHSAIVFSMDEEFSRYFQLAAGLKAQEEFIKKHDYDLFYWKIRFFKELQKDGYFVYVSAGTGEVIAFFRLIEDIEPRQNIGEDAARIIAEKFLENTFGMDPQEYDLHKRKSQRYEKRVDYTFSWEKKGVSVPWKVGQGAAKLLIGATVSGDSITEFYKNQLELPEKFKRYVDNQFIIGEYLYNVYFIIFLVLLVCATVIMIKRKGDLIPRLAKKWFYFLAWFLIAIYVVNIFNVLQKIVMAYLSTVSFGSFLGISIARLLLGAGFLAISLVIPGIAGESLRNEAIPGKKYCSFLHYLRSSFFTRSMARSVLFGYVLCVIMLGFQAVIFYFGQKTLGVWREWYSLSQFSSAYVPLFSAFAIAASAALTEEVIFRLFGISLAKKYLRNTFIAVTLTAVIWGLGHTAYPIFPVWFRIIEVGLLGIFYGFIFLRFGLIPLIAAHYLFDAFWCSTAYIFGFSTPGLFVSALAVLSIPFVFAIIAYFLDKSDDEKEIKVYLDRTQEYNLDVLAAFIAAKKAQNHSAAELQKELIDNNWDPSLVEMALRRVFGGR